MKGLALAEKYYMEVGRPAIMALPQAAAGGYAAGLVGEGSECLGFDDDYSRDHDWGPGFCIWLTDAQYDAYGEKLKEIYESLPAFFEGYERVPTDLAGQRVGVFRIREFYSRFLGMDCPPKSLSRWLALPESYLATAANGKVFEDKTGEFTRIRETLLAFYPEDIRLKKMAARLAVMAREGQYNYPRCLRRGDVVAAGLALSAFTEAAISFMYLMNKRYMPYYKWAWRGLAEIPGCQDYQRALRELMLLPSENKIEEIAAMAVQVLTDAGLSESGESFLQPHAMRLMDKIEDPVVRSRHILEG